MPNGIVIVGAGGFARELKWMLSEIGNQNPTYRFAGYVVSDLSKLGPYDSREEVLGDVGWLIQNKHAYDALALGIGTPSIRRRLGRELRALLPEVRWPALVHPSARVDVSSVTLGVGTIVCANVVATVNVSLADFCMVNLSCTIGHEATIGEGCVLNPSVNISGGVTLDAEVLVGTGAQVLQYIHVGCGATIGAGAVVTKNVQPGDTVVGMPARPLARKSE